MGNGDVFDKDASIFAEVPKMVTVNVVLRSVMMLFGRPNLWMISSKSSTAFFAVTETSGLYSIHLENLLMVTYTYQKPPSAGLDGLIISSPQHAKGQDAGIVCKAWAEMWICLAKNWQFSHRRTNGSASVTTEGQ